MKTSLITRDGRLIARIINLAYQFGCSYSEISSRRSSGMYTATIELSGPPDALRRLDQKVITLIANEKEPNDEDVLRS
jgi:hypothetical protein